MLTFFHAAMLAALAGLALPVLIHLLARPRPKSIPFSSIAFLKAIQSRKAGSFRLRQIVLLILRTAAVACLVLAFARPVLRSASSPPRSREPSVSAWVVDESLSMAREGVWSRTVRNASALAEMMAPGERAAVVWTAADGGPGPDSLLKGREIVRFLESREPGWMRGSTLDALDRAAVRLAGAPGPDPEMFLFSDMQASGFTAERDTSAIRKWRGTLFVLAGPGETANRGVPRAGLEWSFLDDGRPPRISADVRDYGGRSWNDCMVRFFLADRAVAQQTVSLKPGRTRTASVPVMEDAGGAGSGWIWGKVRCGQDGFPQDDERWFCAFLPKSVRVLIVGGTEEDAGFFRFALRPRDESPSRFDVRAATFAGDWIPLLDRSDAVFLVNPGRPSGRGVQSLRRFVEAGGGLFIAPGNGTDIARWNDSFFVPTWGDTLAVRPVKADTDSGASAAGFSTLGRVDAAHPLLRGVFERGRTITRSPKFFRSVEMKGKIRKAVLSFSDGSPFISELRLGQGLVLFMGSGVHPEWSTLAFSPVFPPLAVRIAETLAAQGLGTAGQSVAGDSLCMTLPARSGSRRFQAELPSGDRVTLSPRMRSGRLLLTLPEAETCGIYRFFEADSLVGLFAVNPDPRESDFRSIDEETLAGMCPYAKIVFLDPEKPMDEQIRSLRSGRELWREALALGLLLLIAETLLCAVWK